jgi:hypothetical protein
MAPQIPVTGIFAGLWQKSSKISQRIKNARKPFAAIIIGLITIGANGHEIVAGPAPRAAYLVPEPRVSGPSEGVAVKYLAPNVKNASPDTQTFDSVSSQQRVQGYAPSRHTVRPQNKPARVIGDLRNGEINGSWKIESIRPGRHDSIIGWRSARIFDGDICAGAWPRRIDYFHLDKKNIGAQLSSRRFTSVSNERYRQNGENERRSKETLGIRGKIAGIFRQFAIEFALFLYLLALGLGWLMSKFFDENRIILASAIICLVGLEVAFVVWVL